MRWRAVVRGWVLGLAVLALGACDGSAPPPAPSSSAAESPVPPPQPVEQELPPDRPPPAPPQPLALETLEVDQEGTVQSLVVAFSRPLAAGQDWSARVRLVDVESGPPDGAWQRSADGRALIWQHLAPERRFMLTIDGQLQAQDGGRLAAPVERELETRPLPPMVGFASRGSLLPSRLAEGLPVIAVNLDQVDVDFFRIQPRHLVSWFKAWGREASLGAWEAGQLLPHAELVYSGRFALEVERNQRSRQILPLQGIEALQPAGVYFAVMRQAGTYAYSNPATLFTRSDLGLSVHRYTRQLGVFTQSLADGRPLTDVELLLLGQDGQVLARGSSDEQGHARLPWSGAARLLLAVQDGQTSLLELDRPALDLSEFTLDGPPARDRELFVFGPRDLYRPGETLLLNALLRDGDGYPVGEQPVSAQLQRPDGETVHHLTWRPRDGLYQLAYPIAPGAPTGRWQLVYDLGDGVARSHGFLVEEFLPERMALALRNADGEAPLAPDQAAEFELEGRYLYGAPAAGNRVQAELHWRPLREAVATLPGFEFGDITEEGLNGRRLLDALRLDEAGQGRLSIPSSWAALGSPLTLQLQASLQESGGRAVSRQLSRPVWPAPRLPGLRPGFEGHELGAHGEADFELVMADPGGRLHAAQGLTLRLIREQRDYHWRYSESGGWRESYTERHLLIESRVVDLPATAPLAVRLPVAWGPYRVELEDPQTGVVSSLRFWARRHGQDSARGGAAPPDQVRLALDRPAYAAGEVARIEVTPPEGGSGYLLLESADGPLWWRPIEVPATGASFELPIAESWQRHDLYLSAMVVRPGLERRGEPPKRALGLLHLPLQREARRLDLHIEAPAQMRPGQDLEIDLQADVAADEELPEGLRVLVAAVDVGVLALTDYRTPDPHAAFFGRRGHQVDHLDVYGQLIAAGEGRLARLRFGGDAGLQRGGRLPATPPQIVALQSEPLTLDAEGRGRVRLPIPDFNGELRLMAQVWGEQRFGAAEALVQVAAPVVAELSMPRFLAGGDSAELALDLTNRSGHPQQLRLDYAGDGLLELGEAVVGEVALADGERRTLHLPVRAQMGLGTGRLTLRIQGLQLPGEVLEPLQREWRLGIRPPWPARTRRYAAVIGEDPWTLPADGLAGVVDSGRQALLSLSSRPPLQLAEQVRELRAYPYGCLEQTVSGLYPALYADATQLQRLGIEGEADAERRRHIDIGIQRLLGMQRHNGGFGLWGRDDTEEYWLTVYATDFLLRARAQGHAVPDAALEQAARRLRRYLLDPREIDPAASGDAGHTRFAVQAYAAQVLARSHQAPLGALRQLDERRDQARSGLPLVQLGLALETMGDPQRGGALIEEGLQRSRPVAAWLADYGSPLRDTALILALLQEREATPGAQIEGLLLGLSDDLHGQRWLSTQERGALYLAGRRLLDAPAGHWAAGLDTAAGARRLDGRAGLALALEGAELDGGVAVRNLGQTPLYLRLLLSGYGEQPPRPRADNLYVERRFLDLEGRPLDNEILHSGQQVLVHLRVSAAMQRVPDALVVDLLPAGLELENQNLAHSLRLEDAADGVRDLLEKMTAHAPRYQAFRDDRYVAQLAVPTHASRHLLYLARAVTPGRYRVPPPQVESMYRPQWQALGWAPDWLEVRP